MHTGESLTVHLTERPIHATSGCLLDHYASAEFDEIGRGEGDGSHIARVLGAESDPGIWIIIRLLGSIVHEHAVVEYADAERVLRPVVGHFAAEDVGGVHRGNSACSRVWDGIPECIRGVRYAPGNVNSRIVDKGEQRL